MSTLTVYILLIYVQWMLSYLDLIGCKNDSKYHTSLLYVDLI